MATRRPLFLASADGLAADFDAVIESDNRFRRREACDELARFTLMLMDGVFVVSKIESDSPDLGRAFRMISLGARATAERLVADALNDSTPGNPRSVLDRIRGAG